MKMTLVENSPGMSSTKCTYSNSLRIWVGCAWYKTLTCHSQWIDSMEICDLVWALGHLVSSPYRPQAFLKTFGLDAIKKENALVLSLWKVNWTCKNSIQGLSIVMCIVDQVPLSAFTKSTRLQAQKWGQPWDFLTTDSKWSSSQASYSSSMETHSLESSRSSDVTRDSGTTTHPHGPTKLVDSLQELGGLPNRQDGLGDLSEEWSATSLDSLDVWRLKGFGLWKAVNLSISQSIYLIYLFVWESIRWSIYFSIGPIAHLTLKIDAYFDSLMHRYRRIHASIHACFEVHWAVLHTLPAQMLLCIHASCKAAKWVLPVISFEAKTCSA